MKDAENRKEEMNADVAEERAEDVAEEITSPETAAETAEECDTTAAADDAPEKDAASSAKKLLAERG